MAPGDDDGGDGERGGATISSTAVADTHDLGSLASALHRLAGVEHVRPHLGVGAVIDGAYRIERAIGEGGMGVVYLARDVRLARDVAIKVGTAVSSAALARAGREALALARLSHPNVVVVYQVGEISGRLYIAMELVAGGNARQWLAARPRGWREIVALYAAAGDGLAAAHAAGLVHRDFKPDNVLVGEQERPRVADFGLAREAGSENREPASALSPSGTVTQTGAVVGTPAYMAPEQLAGEDVDARADQFGFCAALWEALFGVRPFSGRTPAEISTQIERGAPAAPPSGSRRVPRAMVAALQRGLRHRRSDRWPAMVPLLAELRRDTRARRRRIATAAGAAAVLAATVGVTMNLRGAPDPCTDGPDRIAAVWNPARAAQLAGAFEAAGSPTSGRLIRARIDAYARQWAVSHREACLATRVDGSQSEAILDRRMMCLAHAGAQLDASVAALVAARRDTIEKAPDTLALLPDLRRCADVATLANQARLPADPVRRAKIQQVDRLLTRLAVADMPGSGPTLRVTAEAALAGARATGWSPLVARAMSTRALLLEKGVDAGSADALEEAVRESLAAGDDDAAGALMVRLADELARRDRPEDAARWVAMARVEWRRIGEPAWLETQILSAEAARLRAAGDAPGALAAVEAWVAADRRTGAGDPAVEALRHRQLGDALHDAGRLADAEREGELALQLVTTALGDNHPTVADYAVSLANVDGDAGRLDRAVELARRAVAIDLAWYGPDDARVAHVLHALGRYLELRGDFAEARTVLRRALDVAQRAGLDAGRVARIEGTLGNADDDAGDWDAAMTHYLHAEELLRTAGAAPTLIATIEVNVALIEDHTGHVPAALARARSALAVLETVGGAESSNLVDTLYFIGAESRAVGKLDDSLRYLRRAVAIIDREVGADNPRGIDGRNQLARTLVAMGKAGEAVEILEPAMIAVERGRDIDAAVGAEIRMVYADALWAAGGDHARARAEATRARDTYAGLGGRAHVDISRRGAEAWLRAHR